MSTDAPAEREKISRRGLLLGAGAAGAIGAAGIALAAGTDTTANGQGQAETGTASVPAAGAHQAGIDRPAAPQQHCIVALLELDTAALRTSLRALGERITELTAAPHGIEDVTPDGPGDMTITVGLGEAALAATAYPELAELVTLPVFAGDDTLEGDRLGGELFLSINSSEPSVLDAVLAALVEVVAGARIRWSEFGFRDASEDGIVRNPFGYFDGIIGPHGSAELQENVWIADGPLAGGTVGVIRRFRLDVDGFRQLHPDERDTVMGRVQSSGAPLSGGERDDEINLSAKSADGSLLVPLRAHARAAHPSFTGSKLMLRRSYGFRAAENDRGLLFISYQDEVGTFARTQLRLDESDDLMGFATPTATAAFAVLPGVSDGAPLGGTLF